MHRGRTEKAVFQVVGKCNLDLHLAVTEPCGSRKHIVACRAEGKSPHGTTLRTISVTGGVTETITGEVRCYHGTQGKANTSKHWLICTMANPKAIHA